MPNENKFHTEGKFQTFAEAEYRNLEGKLHTVSATFTPVADGEKNYVEVEVGERPLRLVSDPNGSGAFFARVYEDDGGIYDVDDTGTELTPEPINRADQSYSLDSNLAFEKNPTVTDPGTEIIEEYSAGSAGKNDAKPSTPGVVTPRTRMILAPNTKYLFEIEDATTDTDNDTYGIIMNFWETKFDF